MAHKLPDDLAHIKRVVRGGKTYEYFRAGKDFQGKEILKALPPRSDKRFGGTYAAFLSARTAKERQAPSPTMRQLIQEYQRTQKWDRLADNTQFTYLIYMRVIEDQMGDAPVREVERKDIVALLAKMEDRGGAANMTLLVARNLFTLALKKEWVAINPAKDIEQLEYDDREYEPWPEDLVAKGLSNEQLGFPIALLYYTGQRIGDVCKMRWTDIEDGVVHVVQQKTGKELWVPIHSGLGAILEAQPRAVETLLFGPKGKPRRPSTLRAQLQAWAAKHDQEIVPHGLRKNAVNTLLECGCTLAETASITGQTLQVVEHYAKKMNVRRMAKKAMGKWDGTKEVNGNGVENG